MDLTSLGGGGGGPNDRVLFVKKHVMPEILFCLTLSSFQMLSSFWLVASLRQEHSGVQTILADKWSTKCKYHPNQKASTVCKRRPTHLFVISLGGFEFCQVRLHPRS